MSPTGGRLLYAFTLEAPDGDLDRKKSSLSEEETDLSELSNEELSDSLSLYYENVRYTGESIWGEIIDLIAISEEREIER